MNREECEGVMMTREDVCRYLNAIMNCTIAKSTMDDYCVRLRTHDAEQRAEIERLQAINHHQSNAIQLLHLDLVKEREWIGRLQAQLETAKSSVSADFVNRAKVLAKEIFDCGMQTDTHELDLATAEFRELWQIAQRYGMGNATPCQARTEQRLLFTILDKKMCLACGQKDIQKWNAVVNDAECGLTEKP